MNVSDWQHEQNRKALAELQELGFTFEIDANGYMVHWNGEFVSGASVKLPREKPLHWKHATANRRENLQTAVTLAARKYQQSGGTNG